MDVIKIGNRIKHARDIRNYTLDYIASEIGVAKSTIQRYENGLISKPKLPVLQAIADVLRVNPAWLSGQDVPMEQDDSLAIIIEQLQRDTGLTLEEVAKKANVPLYWLQNIDSFVPGAFGPDGIEYEWITRVANVFGISGSILRTALSKQEVPLPDDLPRVTAKEAFALEPYNNKTSTIAAHFDGDEYTEEELDKIKEFAAFVKSTRKNEDKRAPQKTAPAPAADAPLAFPDHLTVNAAHARNDVEATDEMQQHDENIMDNDDEWK